MANINCPTCKKAYEDTHDFCPYCSIIKPDTPDTPESSETSTLPEPPPLPEPPALQEKTTLPTENDEFETWRVGPIFVRANRSAKERGLSVPPDIGPGWSENGFNVSKKETIIILVVAIGIILLAGIYALLLLNAK